MNDHHLGQIISCHVLYENPYSDEVTNVISKVSYYFGKHPSYLMVKDRKPKRIYMRQIAIDLLLKIGLTQAEVAQIFDISKQAVCKHRSRVNGFLKVDNAFRNEIMQLTAYKSQLSVN